MLPIRPECVRIVVGKGISPYLVACDADHYEEFRHGAMQKSKTPWLSNFRPKLKWWIQS
jgi:hypothetical protein